MKIIYYDGIHNDDNSSVSDLSDTSDYSNSSLPKPNDFTDYKTKNENTTATQTSGFGYGNNNSSSSSYFSSCYFLESEKSGSYRSYRSDETANLIRKKYEDGKIYDILR